LFLRSIRVVWWWCIRFTGWLVVLLNFHDLCPSSSASEVWVVSNPFGVCFVFFRSSLWPWTIGAKLLFLPVVVYTRSHWYVKSFRVGGRFIFLFE
jgi:hypothetical protein